MYNFNDPILKEYKKIHLITECDSNFGGKGEFELPENHKAALKVPKGGSCCSNCEYISKNKDGKPTCTNQYFIKWNGGDEVLPGNPDELCSDWWEPNDEKGHENKEEHTEDKENV